MANAKRCDICGEFYTVPDYYDGLIDDYRNTSMVRILRRKTSRKIDHDVMQFDSCEKCLQDTLDYILAKQADWKTEE